MVGKDLVSTVSPILTHHAAADSVIHVPYLPPEVHRIIAQHIGVSDLPNYRLARKDLAIIGAEELFQSITFHCSSVSIARVQAVKRCDRLNKYVRTIAWDTNFWRISDVKDLHEWRRYIRGRVFAEQWRTDAGTSSLAGEYAKLEMDREEWGRYLDNMADEKKVRNFRTLQDVFTGFKNLHKVHILNGDLVDCHRGIRRVGGNPSRPQHASSYWRGESLYNDGVYVRDLERPCGHALVAFQSFQAITWRLKKLRLDAVCWKVFRCSMGDMEALQNLSSLHLRLTLKSKPLWGRDIVHHFGLFDAAQRAREVFGLHHFAHFLTRLPGLQSLKLDFYGRFCDNDGRDFAPAALSDIFADDYTSPELRKLSLSHFDSTPQALLSLLRRHRTSLEVLNLHEMKLEATELNLAAPIARCEYTWSEMFRKMKEILHLERAYFSGRFTTSDTSVSACDFTINKPLGFAAAAYLTDGGKYPFS